MIKEMSFKEFVYTYPHLASSKPLCALLPHFLSDDDYIVRLTDNNGSGRIEIGYKDDAWLLRPPAK